MTTLAEDLIALFRRHGVLDADQIVRADIDAFAATLTIYDPHGDEALTIYNDDSGVTTEDNFPVRVVTIPMRPRQTKENRP